MDKNNCKLKNTVHKCIKANTADFVLFTDASLTGWGCACDIGRKGGHWDHTEAQDSINVLELKAGLLALKSFARTSLTCTSD